MKLTRRSTSARVFGVAVLAVLAWPSAALATPRQTAEPARVVVQMESGTDASAVMGTARGKGANLLKRHSAKSAGDVIVFDDLTHAEALALSASLDDMPGVSSAEPDARVHALYTPNDPLFPQLYGLMNMGAPSAWTLARGAGVTVAVIDTGVDLVHQDLSARVDTTHDYDFVNADATAQDDEGHGTHVAGTIAATMDNSYGTVGVAPEATILPVKVLDAAGDGYDSEVAMGVRWAADKGAKIINLSLGGSEDTSVMKDAVAYAVSKGCVVVAASGNNGGSRVLYPAAYPGVIAVGAVDSSNVRPYWSNTGLALDVVAPGSSILSSRLGGGTLYESGTSMATPHAAGAAALVASLHTTWTADQITNTLLHSTTELGARGWDSATGFGFINVTKALAATSPLAGSDDDRLPGVPITDPPLSDTLGIDGDTDDFRTMWLRAGQSIAITMSADPDTDFDLYFFDADAYNTANYVARSASASTSAEHLTVTAPRSSSFALDVARVSGAGAYTLTWETQPYPTELSAALPATYDYSSSAVLSGTLSGVDGQPVGPGLPVRVEARLSNSSTWTSEATVTTGANGSYSYVVKPSKRSYYRAVFGGSAGYQAAASAQMVIAPRVYLSAPYVPSSALSGALITANGTLKPRHASGSKIVRVSMQRYESGRWVERKVVYATTSDRDSTSSSYTARFRLSAKGNWRLVSRVYADAEHATTTSRPDYLSIR